MIPLHVQLVNSTLQGVLKRLHFPLDVMLMCVRWYAAYSLSLRNLEEMMAERGVAVDHATIHRWALKILPTLAKVFRGPNYPVGRSWRVDETYVRVAGEWPPGGRQARPHGGLPAHGYRDSLRFEVA